MGSEESGCLVGCLDKLLVRDRRSIDHDTDFSDIGVLSPGFAGQRLGDCINSLFATLEIILTCSSAARIVTAEDAIQR